MEKWPELEKAVAESCQQTISHGSYQRRYAKYIVANIKAIVHIR